MYCSSCGAEYPQKINYCKRCGANMVTPTNNIEVHVPRPQLTGMFNAVAGSGVIGLLVCFIAYYNFAKRGMHDEELFVPFIMGLLFLFGIEGGLIWQLARMVSTFQKSMRNAKVEMVAPPHAQPMVLPAQPEPVGSITDHTTRSFEASLYVAPEKRQRDLA